MKIKAVDYSMYRVSDLERSIAFYRDVLGLKPNGQGEGWAEFLAGDDAVVLGAFDFDMSKVGGGAYIALAVDDVKRAVEELKKKGVRIDGEIWDFPSVCDGVMFLDPDGNRIALHHRTDGTVG